MKMKKIVSVLALLGMFLVPSAGFATGGYTPDFSGEPYTTDLTSCYTYYNNGIYECASGTYVLTAWTGSNNPCATVSSAPVWSASGVDSTTNSTTNATGTGGYYFNCLGNQTYNNWVCLPDVDNINTNHIETLCTNLATSVPNTSTANTDTNCLGNYMNCSTANGGADDNNNTCESAKNTTDTDSLYDNTHFGSTCTTYVCDTGWMSCNLLASSSTSDGDGCETSTTADTDELTGAGKNVHTHRTNSCDTLACDTGYIEAKNETAEDEGCEIIQNTTTCTITTVGSSFGLEGVCTGSSGTTEGTYSYTDATYGTLSGICACSPGDVPEFAVGGFVDSDGNYTVGAATFITDNPLLWGQQNGDGSFLEFSNSLGMQFEVNNEGVIVAGFIGEADLSLATNGTEGQVLGITETGIEWITPEGGSSVVSLDDAYNNGTNITVDGAAITLDGADAATSDILVVKYDTDDIFKVEVSGDTILKQLKLISANTNGVDGKPAVTCDATTVGNIAYVTTAAFIGEYYGCKQVGETAYEWVSLSIFGS